MALTLILALLLARISSQPSHHHGVCLRVHFAIDIQAAFHQLLAHIGGSLRGYRLLRRRSRVEIGAIGLHQVTVYMHVALPYMYEQPSSHVVRWKMRKT